MPVSLSIKDVPDELAAALRARAARHHRSLQRELLALVEAAVADPSRIAREPEASYRMAAVPRPPAPGPEQADDLLDELDAIVAGSRWGSAPLLDRDQLHDRALARELDFDCREAELRNARDSGARQPGR
ncbi:MAG TPA: Arc family DNA-binding protein [Rubrivivax sp.]|nr:Arc family DNA-binding protein [Rubrivivax sp.]